LRQLTAAAATRSAPRRRTGWRRQDQHWNIGVNVQFLIDNIILIAVAFFSGAMLVWPAIRGRASGPSLSTLQATQLINARNPQIVDLRSADDFAKGSLPNARNLPSDKLNDRIGDLKKDKPVLLVCATGTSAGRIAAMLRSRGFAEVFVLGGGIAGWREAGLPVRT
jgi:rhodanese-related sulfurtransferase